MSKTRYCPSCGSENDVNSQFCQDCGLKFAPSNKNEFNKEQPVDDNIQPPSQQVVYAKFGDRFLAFIIDSIVISIIAGFFTSFIGLSLWTNQEGYLMFTISEGIVMLLYFFLMENFNSGQTVGKLAMKLQTVNEITLDPVNEKEAILHSIGKAFFAVIDLIIGLIAKGDAANPMEENQIRITQRFSHTSVIKLV